jgi:two-component sensor histidine kinase
MAQNLLVSMLGIRDVSLGGKLSQLLRDFHPEILQNELVINLVKKRYSGIGGTLQITSFDLSEKNKIHVLRDISELSLKEKEIKVKGALVKEIHHRVKNNLNAVAALLRMQLRRSNDAAVKEAFKQAILRLDSITLVHEFLAHADNVQIVDIGQLIKDIVRNLQHTLGYEEKRITVSINCSSGFYLDSEQAVSVALVVNELVSNCYEHAFKDMLIGEVVLDLFWNDDNKTNFTLVVRDNGVGIPESFNKENPESLGWHIINTLVIEDLNGKIFIKDLAGLKSDNKKGTEIKIEAEAHAKQK